jgi:hypothetical protein
MESKNKNLLVVAGVAGFAVFVAMSRTPAHAVNGTPASAVSKTCAAFKTWEHSKTNAHLDAMMADSFAAPWKYVGQDAAGLYSDIRGKAKSSYVNSDLKYFREDCPA